MQSMRTERAADIIRAEYERTPGLRVSFWQAQQLWNLPGDLCERALARLINVRFLMSAADGTFVRRDESLREIESMLRAM